MITLELSESRALVVLVSVGEAWARSIGTSDNADVRDAFLELQRQVALQMPIDTAGAEGLLKEILERVPPT